MVRKVYIVGCGMTKVSCSGNWQKNRRELKIPEEIIYEALPSSEKALWIH